MSFLVFADILLVTLFGITYRMSFHFRFFFCLNRNSCFSYFWFFLWLWISDFIVSFTFYPVLIYDRLTTFLRDNSFYLWIFFCFYSFFLLRPYSLYTFVIVFINCPRFFVEIIHVLSHIFVCSFKLFVMIFYQDLCILFIWSFNLFVMILFKFLWITFVNYDNLFIIIFYQVLSNIFICSFNLFIMIF